MNQANGFKQISPWTWLLAAVTSLVSLWLLATGLAGPPNHNRITLGLLLAWVAALFLRAIKDAQLPTGRSANPLWRAPFSVLLALAPGLILLAYGLFAPAQPSLANSGVDVCAYEVGWCVSGTRAFIVFGGVALLIGIAVAYAIVKAAIQANRPPDYPPQSPANDVPPG